MQYAGCTNPPPSMHVTVSKALLLLLLTNSQNSFCLSSQTMTKLNTVFDGEARDPGNKKQLAVDTNI